MRRKTGYYCEKGPDLLCSPLLGVLAQILMHLVDLGVVGIRVYRFGFTNSVWKTIAEFCPTVSMIFSSRKFCFGKISGVHLYLTTALNVPYCCTRYISHRRSQLDWFVLVPQ